MVHCSGCIVRNVSFKTMTKEERINGELEKLYNYRREAMARNDFAWLLKNDAKIKEKEKELEECKKYRPMKLKEVLDGKSEATKNEVYRSLLKISLAADFVNDCAEEVKTLMKNLGFNDFTLRTETAELCKLSQKIASFVIIPNQRVLTDMLVDDDRFIGLCHAAADEHLKNTLDL